MVYVFDTSSFIVLGHYFPERFPSFWEKFEYAVATHLVVSCREVLRELEGRGNKEHLEKWIGRNKSLFAPPTSEESQFVSQIFSVPHFLQLVSEQQRLKGVPVADPFVIASANVRNGCVVTEEVKKPSAARIPNVCEHFSIPCTNLDGFMQANRWTF